MYGGGGGGEGLRVKKKVKKNAIFFKLFCFCPLIIKITQFPGGFRLITLKIAKVIMFSRTGLVFN